MYHDSITSGGLCTRLRILGRVGRAALPTPTRFRDCPAPCKRTSPKLPRHCEPHSGAPQGGLSCPFGAIHLLAISWYCVCVRTFFQEIPTACGLGMTVAVGHCSIYFTRAIIQLGRRGQCRPPYKKHQKVRCILYFLVLFLFFNFVSLFCFLADCTNFFVRASIAPIGISDGSGRKSAGFLESAYRTITSNFSNHKI